MNLKFFLKRKTVVFVVLFGCAIFSNSYAGEDSYLYSKAVHAAKRNKLNSSFMHLSRIVNRHPSSKFFTSALFSVGEYYYVIGDYFNAKNAFEQFIEKDSQSKSAVFARAYLIKIVKDNQESAAKYEKEIVTFKRLSLFFRDFKIIKYRSAFLKKYKAVYFIDKVEVYINNALFIEIPF